MAALLAALCALHLAAAPADGRTPLLVLELEAETGIEASAARTVTALVSAELARFKDLNVIAGADVKRMLELEGERQQLDCGDASCLADLAGALGARLVVFGTVGRLGEKTVLTLNLFDSQLNESVGREFVEVGDVGALSSALPPVARKLIERFYSNNGLTLPDDHPPSVLPLVTAGAGGVAVAVGAGLAVVGVLPLLTWGDRKSAFEALKDADDVEGAAAVRDEAIRAGDDWNTWGVALTAVGGGVAVIGAVAIVGGMVGMSE